MTMLYHDKYGKLATEEPSYLRMPELATRPMKVAESGSTRVILEEFRLFVKARRDQDAANAATN